MRAPTYWRYNNLMLGLVALACIFFQLPVLVSSADEPRTAISQTASVFKQTTHKLQPNPEFFSRRNARPPLPTNRWWTNFFLGTRNMPAGQMPYSVKLTTGGQGGIQINYPNRAVTDKFVFNVWLHDLSLETAEGLQSWQLVHSDDLSVTVAARAVGAGSGTMFGGVGTYAAKTTDPQQASKTDEVGDVEFMNKAHIIVSSISWNVVGVAAVLAMRYLLAFRDSKATRYGSLILSLLGFGMSIAAVVYTHVRKSRTLRALGWGDPEDVDFHFYSPHTITGLVVLIATGLQLILNLIVAFGINSMAAAIPHFLVGFCGLIQVASIITSFLGFVEMNANIWMYLAYAVWIASLVGVSAILEALIQVKKEATPIKSIEMKRSGSTSGPSIHERPSPADRRDSTAQVHQLVNVSASQRYKNMLYALVVALVVSSLVFGAMFLPSVIFTSSDGWDFEEPVPVNGTVVGKYPTNTSVSRKRASNTASGSASYLGKRSIMDNNCTDHEDGSIAPVVEEDDQIRKRTIGTPARGLELNAMTVSLVQGSPFISAKYGGLTPKLRTQHAILTVNDQSVGSTVTGKQFIVRLNNGQSWLLVPIAFSNNVFAPLTVDMSFNIQGSALIGSSKFDGIIRAAMIPPSSDPALALQTLKDYAFAWPVGGEMSYSMNTNEDLAYMKFNFGIESVGGGREDILMTAIPHQRDNFVGDDQTILSGDLKYQTIKGQAKMVSGSTWTIEVPLVSYGFFSPRPIAENRREAVRAALMEDTNAQVPIPWDTYSFGKVASRFARLALIADELQEPSARERMVNKVIELMDPWMRQTHGNSILYDTTWGGLISTNGRNDAGADYGVGWYNDQHYHYGYFVYAASVVAYYNKGWADANKQQIEDMIRNFANPIDDGVFPAARMKDWYHGHSWASGLYEFADGKNQESTSESVNGYYGVYLWGLATNNKQIQNWGRLLMTTEMISTHRYWHMFPRAEDHTNGEPVYEEVFRRQTCIGIVWSTKVDYATWFGGNVEFIHGIQMLPYTPITEILLPKKWVQVEYPILATSLTRQNPRLEQGWRGFVVMTQSILDPNGAWSAATGLNGWDNGNSKTNTLHFIATRPA